jgi:hypothetical protein
MVGLALAKPAPCCRPERVRAIGNSANLSKFIEMDKTMSFRTISILQRIQWISFSAAAALLAATVIMGIMGTLAIFVLNGVDLLAW